MSRSTRERLALLMLAASGIALIATSYLPGTTLTVEGETLVSPDHHGTFMARFEVGPASGVLETLRASVDAPRGLDSRLAADATATVGEVTVIDRGAGMEIPPSACPTLCTVDVRGTVRWVGPSEPALSVRWSATLNAAGPGFVEVPVTGSVLEGPPPTIPALGWLGLGALLAAVTAAAWLAAGPRYRTVRLALAAAGIVLPTAGVVFLTAAGLTMEPASLVSALLAVLTTGLPYLVLAVGLVLAVRALVRGNARWLPIMGVLYVMLIGGPLALFVATVWTYRPHELALLGLVAGVPAAAAITSAPLVPGVGALRISGPGIVYGTQILLIVGYAVVALPMAPFLLLGIPLALVTRDPSALANVLLVAFPLAVLILLVLGLRGWQRGRRRLLVVADVIALPGLLLAVLAGGLIGGLLASLGLLLAIPAGILAVVALVGIVAGLIVVPPVAVAPAAPLVPSAAGIGPTGLVAPPPAHEDGDEQGRQGDEVGRVEDEGDAFDGGQRS